MRTDANRFECFEMLAGSIVKLTVPRKSIVNTVIRKVLTNGSCDLNKLEASNLEEVDIRLYWPQSIARNKDI